MLELVMAYDPVEFATAIKPLLLKALLERTEQVFSLHPDLYVMSPMTELSPALAGSPGGILLTPHFLRPARAGEEIGDGHMLLGGVNNLDFCGVGRPRGPRPTPSGLGRRTRSTRSSFHFTAAYMSDPAEAERFVKDATGRWGRIDLLVNNAGVAREGVIGLFGDGGIDQVVDLDLRGPST